MKHVERAAEVPACWTLSFDLSAGADGPLLEVRAGEKQVLTVSREGGLSVCIHTDWAVKTSGFGGNPTFDFTLNTAKTAGHFEVCWRGYSVRLCADGCLEDEEWPLGEVPPCPWDVFCADAVSGTEIREAAGTAEDPEVRFEGAFHIYNHPGSNTGVGDCMPFDRDGRWCLYYLLDRRGHRSKKGLGAHQWAQVSTEDLRHWTIHPMAVGITEQWEGSICTGSLIRKDDKIYAFYAVRMSDGSPALLTWAVSGDGVHFEKSGVTFSLTDPYEPVSARDPKVFFGADGLYHMLVTTSLKDGGRFGGCLAHLTSPDLTAWTQREPFIVPGYSDQPECSDYFEWNGWYYLVFSNFAIGRYRMSRSPFGPWIRPENDLLDALEVQVPKTAPFGERRFSSGFLARRPRAYAGDAVTHEIYQRPDGTLGVKHAEEMLPGAKKVFSFPPVELRSGGGRAGEELPPAEGDFRLKAVMKPAAAATLFGINLKLAGEDGSGGHSCRIEFDPAAGTAVIVRPREDFGRGAGRDLLRNLNLRRGTAIDLTLCGNILDMALSDGRMMTIRLDEEVTDGTRVEFYALAGDVSVEGIEWTAY